MKTLKSILFRHNGGFWCLLDSCIGKSNVPYATRHKSTKESPVNSDAFGTERNWTN